MLILRALLHLLAIFVGRHWILAVLNTVLTWRLGLWVLHGARQGLPVQTLARWKQVVLVGALIKGAFYLLLGDNRHLYRGWDCIGGMQVPDPVELLRLWPQTRDSIWHPTPAMHMVTLLALTGALSLLIRRAQKVSRSFRALNTLRHFHSPLEPSLVEALRRAAAALAIPTNASLPVLVVAEANTPTPLLLGGFKPILLLSPGIILALSKTEMEMALRHELAHWLRRDHLWRWLLLWVGDVGSVNPFSHRLRAQAIQQEELLCDAMAVSSPADALLMAQAIQKALEVASQQTPGQAGPGEPPTAPNLPDFVVPSLFGTTNQGASSLLNERLENLLRLAQQGVPTQQTAPTAPRGSLGQLRQTLFLLSVRVALGIIVYMKFYLVIGLPL